MTFGTASAIFRDVQLNIFDNAIAFDYGTDAFLLALYNDTPTPNNDVSLANAVYNVDQWVSSSREVFQAGQWAQGGVSLASVTLTTPAADIVMWDSADPASGSAFTGTDIRGCLPYNNTLATKYAASYHDFGGAQSVTAGTFTVLVDANGWNRWTYTAA